MCFVCGLENEAGLQLRFYDDGERETWSDFTIAPRHQGFPGVVHGGVVASILDEVGCRVMMMGGQHDRFGMTAKLDIRYRQPVPQGHALRAVGRVVKDRGRLVTATAQILVPGGAVLAEAELLVTELPPGRLHLDDVDLIGWRVYPD
jgi:uncharacterized protein (TIGR00369 family)